MMYGYVPDWGGVDEEAPCGHPATFHFNPHTGRKWWDCGKCGSYPDRPKKWNPDSTVRKSAIEVKFCDRCGCNYTIAHGDQLPCIRPDGQHTTERRR